MSNRIDPDRPLLAVLIDADNISAKHAKDIYDEITKIGEPALRRVYGDWSKEEIKGWKDPIHELGLVARQETANTTGKNATDIGLVIDAMDILHSGKLNTFVIVSSDSDYTALVNRLREDGREVIVIGNAKANDALKNVCNRFVQIENLSTKSEGTTATKAKSKQDLNQAYQLICNAISRCETEEEWVSLSAIGKNLRAMRPDFDPRTYGFAKLSGLVKAMPRLQFANKDNHPRVKIKN
ncbi:NYN domain-containing protein [uncultured Sulfitobacter sp.]|uniref:NYN domain-containing protein n=1 Tax=uncultured Sulfitobacter sp. TaxID=191468 RepID=UPI00261A6412|nr:NYN domain-containing protein [uncultured Sulfitobacter sp.]